MSMIQHFDQKVAEMKSQFAALPTITRFGQFQVSRTVYMHLEWLMRADTMPGLSIFNEVWNLYIAWANVRTDNRRIAAARAVVDLIKARGWQLPLQRVMAAFSPDYSATPAWAAGAYAAMWTSPGLSGVPYFSLPSADKYFAAWNYEKDRCGYTASYMAAKIIQVRKLKLKPSTANLYSSKLGDARLRGGAQRDVLVCNPTSLARDVANIQAAIGKGYMYQIGVLSGTRGSVQRPEHYLLAIATYDNAILFWDPDATTSNIASRPWGEGFGVLYHVENRFSTAYNAKDFDDVWPYADESGTGRTFGYHLNSPTRHLYQAFTATPRP